MRKSYSNGYATGFATSRKTRKILARLKTKGFVIVKGADAKTVSDLVKIVTHDENQSLTAFVDVNSVYLVDNAQSSKQGFTYGK